MYILHAVGCTSMQNNFSMYKAMAVSKVFMYTDLLSMGVTSVMKGMLHLTQQRA